MDCSSEITCTKRDIFIDTSSIDTFILQIGTMSGYDSNLHLIYSNNTASNEKSISISTK